MRIRQASLARRASLNFSISLKPRPPADLGRVSRSQEIQLIFLRFGLESHQKRVKTDWICLHSETGILKQDIAYVGIAAKIALRRTCFPAPERKLVVQLCDLCLILSTMLAKISRFLRPKCSGKPRYLPMPPSLSIWR